MPVTITDPNGGAPTSTGSYTIGDAGILVAVELSEDGELAITGTLAAYFFDVNVGAFPEHPIYCTDPTGTPPPAGVGTLIFTTADDTQTMTVTVSHAPAPTITSNDGGSTASVDLTAGDTSVTEVTTDMEADFSISGGADAALFTISADDLEDASLYFNSPSTAGTYEVIVRAASPSDAGSYDEQTITVTVTSGATFNAAWARGSNVLMGLN